MTLLSVSAKLPICLWVVCVSAQLSGSQFLFGIICLTDFRPSLKGLKTSLCPTPRKREVGCSIGEAEWEIRRVFLTVRIWKSVSCLWKRRERRFHLQFLIVQNHWKLHQMSLVPSNSGCVNGKTKILSYDAVASSENIRFQVATGISHSWSRLRFHRMGSNDEGYSRKGE